MELLLPGFTAVQTLLAPLISCCTVVSYDFFSVTSEAVSYSSLNTAKVKMDSDDDDERKPAAMFPGGERVKDSPHRRVKPALKKKPAPQGKTGPEKKHLKWDEEVIEEHDQLRGTRMKIDEPNTPYTHYDSGAESDDSRRPKSPANQKVTLSWDALQVRLDSVAAVRDAYPSSPSTHAESDHSDVEDERKKEMHRMEFNEHRKRHYNEFDVVRKFREENPDLPPPEVEGDVEVQE
jgi:protein phosphatase inhibitor 2